MTAVTGNPPRSQHLCNVPPAEGHRSQEEPVAVKGTSAPWPATATTVEEKSRPRLQARHEQTNQRRRRVLPDGDVLTSGGSRTERARLSGGVLAYLVERVERDAGVSVVRSRGAVAAVSSTRSS